MRTLIVHNPKSGFGSDAIYQFQRSIIREGDECVFRLLSAGVDAAAAVKDAAGFDVVVVSGGDGTASSVLTALAGSKIPVCVFPSGTANLFNANLGNTPEPQSLARACRVGKTADVDLGLISWAGPDGKAKERGFVLMSGTGYDAQLMRAALPNKELMGPVAYYAAAMENPKPEAIDFTVTVDGTAHKCRGITCLVANNATIQNEIQIVPNCRMDDGLLDVIVVEISNAAQLIRPLFLGLVDRGGNKFGRPHIRTFSGRHIVVETSKPVPLEVDGETENAMVTRYEARVEPGAMRVVVDAMSTYGNKCDAPNGFGDTEDVAYPSRR